jgi:ribosomal protein S17E
VKILWLGDVFLMPHFALHSRRRYADTTIRMQLRHTEACVICVQGRVRTKTVKRASRVLIEKYYQKLTMDFDTNKRICDEVATIQSKRLRNKIAGFTTVRNASNYWISSCVCQRACHCRSGGVALAEDRCKLLSGRM